MTYLPDAFIKMYLDPREVCSTLLDTWKRHEICLAMVARHKRELDDQLAEFDPALIAMANKQLTKKTRMQITPRLPDSIHPNDFFDNVGWFV